MPYLSAHFHSTMKILKIITTILHAVLVVGGSLSDPYGFKNSNHCTIIVIWNVARQLYITYTQLGNGHHCYNNVLGQMKLTTKYRLEKGYSKSVYILLIVDLH